MAGVVEGRLRTRQVPNHGALMGALEVEEGTTTARVAMVRQGKATLVGFLVEKEEEEWAQLELVEVELEALATVLS